MNTLKKRLSAIALGAGIVAASLAVAAPAEAGQTGYTYKACGVNYSVAVTSNTVGNTGHLYTGKNNSGAPYSWTKPFTGGGTHTSYSGMNNGSWAVNYSTSIASASSTCFN